MAQVLLSALGVLAGCAVVWFLFRSVHSDGGAADDARNQLDSATAGQREAADALDTVTNGADASADTAQGIADRVSDAQSAIDSAQSAIDSAQSHIDESTAVIEDSARRYAECARILDEIRAGARTDGGAAADAKDSVAGGKR